VQKLKSAPKRFTLGIKAEIEKKHFNLPQVLKNAELYGLVLAPRLKQGIPSNLAMGGTLSTHTPFSPGPQDPANTARPLVH
jgi:hypothetical protein